MPYYGGTPMAANPDALMARLMRNGLSRAQAAAMVGNLRRESSLISNNVNAGEGAYGLMQWRGDRFQALQDFASKQNKPWTDPDVQADFAVHEMRSGNEQKAGAAFLGATDVAGANQAMKGVIRYADRPGETEKRGELAQRVLAQQALSSTSGAGGPAQVQARPVANAAPQISRETLAYNDSNEDYGRPKPKGIRGGLNALGYDVGKIIDRQRRMGGVLGTGAGQQANPPAPGSPEQVAGFRGLFSQPQTQPPPGVQSYIDPNTGSQMATGLPGRYDLGQGDVLNLGRPPAVTGLGQASRPAATAARDRLPDELALHADDFQGLV